jgi:hypothetical protein
MLSSLQILGTRKFVTADVVFVDTGRNQHLSHPTDQGGRPSDIVDRSSQLIQILGQHFLVDPPGLAVPSFFRAPHLRHCGNETKLWVCLFQILQDFHEGRVFGPPVRIKKVQFVWRASWSACRTILENGVTPIPPARNTAGLAEFLCSVKEPIAESIFTTVPSGIFFSERLNAVSRMRVANISWSSNGALAMEKVRTFPSASVSGGSAMSDQRIAQA